VGSRVWEEEWKILHTQYTLHSHAEGTGFGNREEVGLPTESKSDIRADYGQLH